VDRRAARARRHARLAKDRDGLARGERGFDRAQLGVDLRERRELREDEVVIARSEAMKAEDEAAEIAIRELASLAQEPRPAARATARAEA
jgi:hypothetical protein